MENKRSRKNKGKYFYITKEKLESPRRQRAPIHPGSGAEGDTISIFTVFPPRVWQCTEESLWQSANIHFLCWEKEMKCRGVRSCKNNLSVLFNKVQMKYIALKWVACQLQSCFHNKQPLAQSYSKSPSDARWKSKPGPAGAGLMSASAEGMKARPEQPGSRFWHVCIRVAQQEYQEATRNLISVTENNFKSHDKPSAYSTSLMKFWFQSQNMEIFKQVWPVMMLFPHGNDPDNYWQRGEQEQRELKMHRRLECNTEGIFLSQKSWPEPGQSSLESMFWLKAGKDPVARNQNTSTGDWIVWRGWNKITGRRVCKSDPAFC